ncbi:hypothetical protein ON003_02350 [Janibacter hoylei]|nr:hypothetical protein [Janibacter hoylei]MCW4600575.1 hypothetical protein [Janibacter hoylei]
MGAVGDGTAPQARPVSHDDPGADDAVAHQRSVPDHDVVEKDAVDDPGPGSHPHAGSGRRPDDLGAVGDQRPG